MTLEEAKLKWDDVPLGKCKNITGMVFGDLVALYRTENHVQPNLTPKSVWVCRCSCGNIKPIMYSSLSMGYSVSCGKCLDNDKPVFHGTQIEGVVLPSTSGYGNTKHGLTHTALYKTWLSILSRCYDESLESYKYYGGKGIKLCDRWLNIENFISDNKDCFEEGLTIDRVDTNENYKPSNVRWITIGEQAANTGPKHWGKVKYKGVCWSKQKGRYRANLYYKGKQTHLGFFDNPVDAALRYDEVAFREKGDLAWLNRKYFHEVMVAYNNKNT